MRIRPLLSIGFLLFCSQLFAQFNNPYRLDYDGKNYFVTNKGNGTVTKIDSAFNTSTVITGLYSPNDIFFGGFISGQAILIIDSNQIKIFDPSTYGNLINIDLPTMEAHDGVYNPNNTNEFFVSDRAGNMIIKGTVGSPPLYPITFDTLISGISKPAGMMFDHRDRLLVVTDTVDAGIHWIDINTGYDSVVYSGSVDNMNDLKQGPQLNYYFTNWDDNYLYRLDSSFQNPYRLVGYNNPSGMYVNHTYDYLALCCFNCNKVEYEIFHTFAPLTDLKICPSDSFLADFSPIYNGIGTYNSDNQFILEVSDSNGSFSAPIFVRSVMTDTVPNFMLALLPKREYADSGHVYRFRSTSPPVVSFLTAKLLVHPSPDAYIYDTDTLSICTGSSVLLGQSSKAGHTYDWTPGTYINDSTTTPVTFSSAPVGQYPLTLIEEEPIHGCSYQNELLVIVGPNLSIPQLKDSVAICIGDSINVGVSGLPYFFSWSGSDSLDNSSLGNPSFFDVEDQWLHVVFSDFNLTCSGSDSVYARVHPSPNFGSISDPTDSVCLGAILEPTIPLIGANTYSWSSSGQVIDGSSLDPSFQFDVAGIAWVAAHIISSTTGCIGFDTAHILVRDLPYLPQLETFSQTLCQGTTHELRADLDSNLHYLWTSDHALISNPGSHKPSFLVNADVSTDTVRVLYTDSFGCENEQAFENIIFYVPSVLILDTHFHNGTHYIALKDQRIINQLNANPSPLEISWVLNDAPASSGADTIGWFPRDDFTHGDTLWAVLRYKSGPALLCEFSSEKHEKSNLGSISQLDQKQIRVYPNPGKTGSIIKVESNAPVQELTLLSSSGQVIEKIRGAELELKVASGMYLLRIKSDERHYYRQLIVQ